MSLPKKSLGQHWLNNNQSLKTMVGAGKATAQDFILEIGPGLGTLTAELLATGAQVLTLEFDESLIPSLRQHFRQSENLKIEQGDILKFDFSSLPTNYKIVANIPYYLTAQLFRILSEPATHKPVIAALLVQKEVAERVCAAPGRMSIVAVALQLEYEPSLGLVVPARLFTPPPKVDSQILILEKRPEPLFKDVDNKLFMRIVKAGFAGKRKVLRNSLSAGLHLEKDQTESLLKTAGINPGDRAQALNLENWHKLYRAFGGTID